MCEQMVYNEKVHTAQKAHTAQKVHTAHPHFSVIVPLPFLPSPLNADIPEPLPSAGPRAKFLLVSK